jgi:hypothetical protein
MAIPADGEDQEMIGMICRFPDNPVQAAAAGDDMLEHMEYSIRILRGMRDKYRRCQQI